MCHKNKLLWVFALHLIVLCAGNAWGIGNFNPSITDLRLLPPYCAPRAQPYGNDISHPLVSPWIGMFGGDWIHMHHYCAALLWQQKAALSFGDKKNREGLLNMALTEIAYVERAVTPRFVLRAEMATVKGDALEQLNQTQLAFLSYRQAIESNPTYSNAYARLGALLAKQGDKKSALDTVTRGLQLNPGSKALKRAYDEYGGTLPYPEPLAREVRTEKKEAEPHVTPATPATEVAPPINQDTNATTPVQPATGSPQNPYCRFCTD